MFDITGYVSPPMWCVFPALRRVADTTGATVGKLSLGDVFIGKGTRLRFLPVTPAVIVAAAEPHRD